MTTWPAAISVAVILSTAAGAHADSPDPAHGLGAGEWEAMRAIVPRQYLCHFTREPIAIDGQAKERAWDAAAWTEDFVDIEGDRRPKPRFRTRAKMLWNEKHFYVYAELEEPHVWGSITKKNQVIFHDNDFEVFLSPTGENHNYYEFEMNALGTIWELSLDKPYRDGGKPRDPDNMAGLRSAVHVRGTLNDPADTDEGWSVEITFPWEGLKRFAGSMAAPPAEGDTWRVGFSRVEWLADIIGGKYRKIPPENRPEDNWVWSPQGVINMHCPERWGQVQFTREPPGKGRFKPDPTWPAREALMEVYHRQRVFFDRNKRYAATLAELGTNAALAAPSLAEPLRMTPADKGFLATAIVKLPNGKTATLITREDTRLWRDEK
jgi:hypothetical protein